MKKLLFIFLYLTILQNSSTAQNLISNPSFEDSLGCPMNYGSIALANGWTSYGGTTDYFNSCANTCPSSTCWGVPDNGKGYQPAYHGKSYAGIITFSHASHYHEFMGTQLVQPLSINKKYFVSAYVARANAHNSSGASNNLGFRFFTSNIYSASNNVPYDNFSHINDITIIQDSVNWTRIAGSFIADSNYQYMAIGNFYDDQNTDTMNIFNGDSADLNIVYYFVDYVCVSEDSLWQATTEIISNAEIATGVNLYPNPFIDKISIETESIQQMEIIFYNLYGQKIVDQKFINSTVIDTHNFDQGILFYDIRNINGTIKSGKIIKH